MQVVVRELPIGRWTDAFKDHLIKLSDSTGNSEPAVASFDLNHTEATVECKLFSSRYWPLSCHSSTHPGSLPMRCLAFSLIQGGTLAGRRKTRERWPCAPGCCAWPPDD
jgi:hypothetical protein